MASTSRTSSCARASRSALLLAALLGVGAACSGERTAVAELAKADGPVERDAGGQTWSAAVIGTRFFLGDAARTAAGGATLTARGGATLAMQPYTVLRFGGEARGQRMVVEAGAIDITGTGSYALDIGDVAVARNGTVRVSAGGAGQRTVELKVGEAQISTEGGTIALQVGRAVELGIGAVVVTVNADAAVPDAPPADAGEPAAAATVVEVEHTG